VIVSGWGDAVGFRIGAGFDHRQSTGGVPNDTALKSAIALLEAFARFDGPQREVFVRRAFYRPFDLSLCVLTIDSAVVWRGRGCVGRPDLVVEERALVLGQLDEEARLRLLPSSSPD